MRKTKKILSWLLALSMVLGMLPAAALATEETMDETDIVAEEPVVQESGEPMDDEVQPQNQATSVTVNAVAGQGDYTTIEAAVAAVAEDGTILVTSDIKLAAGDLSITKSFTIKGDTGSGAAPVITKTHGTDKSNRMFAIKEGTVTFENLVLDGTGLPDDASGGNAAIYAYANKSTTATAILGDGVVVTKFEGAYAIPIYSNNGGGSGDQTAQNATTTKIVIRDGVKIYGNSNTGAGNLITTTLGGKLDMEGGEIYSNKVKSGALISSDSSYNSNASIAYSSTVKITGGKIYNNTVGAKGAVHTASTATNIPVELHFGGTAQVYDNKMSDNTARNIYLDNSANADKVYVKLGSALDPGANLHVSLATMPTSGAPKVVVAKGTAGYAATAADAAYFASDIPTTAGINFDSTNSQVMLDYDYRTENTYTVTITKGSNITASGGALNQAVPKTTAMTNVTLSAASGYSLPATATITGSGVTGVTYTNGVISGTPTGNVTVAVGDAIAQRKVTISLTNATRDTTANNGALVQEVSAGTAITPIAITAAAGYKLTSKDLGNGLKLTVGSDVTKGTITGTPTATATVNVTAQLNQYSITISGANCVITNGSQTPTVGGAITDIIVTANAGYVLPATIASNQIGELIYTRDTDDTKATIAGTPTGAVTHTITATARTDFYVKANATAAEATGTKDKPFATIAAAYNAVPANGTATIKLLSDITATAVTNFNAEKTVTIKSDSAVQTVKRDTTLNVAAVFNATKGTVTFENITLDGNAGWDNPTDLKNRAATNTSTAQYMTISDTAAVILGSGSVVQNHARNTTNSTTGMTGGDHGGAIGLDGGSLTMNAGAKIQNNDVTGSIADGGAVSVWRGTFTMEGGILTGNTASRLGGAVRSATGAIVLMTGGEISGNAVTGKGATQDAGGGVLISQGDFTVGKTVTITGNENLSGTTAMADDVSFSNYQASPIITIDGLTSSKIGVRTTTAVVAGTDYKFAVNATNAADDVKHFFANNDTDVGVVFCDGTNDWINGKNVGALTSHTHATKTLWLSVEARIMIVPGVTTGGEGFITLDPEPGTDYGFLAPDVQKPITITNVKGEVVGTQDPNTGWVTFPTTGGPFTVRPMPKGEEVTVVTKPTDATTDPDKGEVLVIVTIPEVGENIYVEITDPDKKATIVIEPSDEKLTYIVTDPDGKVIVTGPGNGGKLELKPLDPGKDYIITTMPNPADPGKPEVGEDIVPGTDPYSPGVTVKTPPVAPTKPTLPTKDITRYPGEGGTDSITVNPTVKDQYYWLVDKTTGQIVAPAAGSGNGFTSPDTDGIVVAGDENGLTFTGLDKNKTYEVRTSSGDPKGTPAVLPIKPVVVAPITVDPDSLTGSIIKAPATPEGKTEITINPADPSKKYAVIDPDTGAVVEITGGTPWTPGGEGKVTLKPLDPGKEYVIVTKDKNDITTDPGKVPGIKITTPVDPTKPLPGTGEPEITVEPDRETITGTGDPTKDGKDKITVTNPGEGYEIAIIDPATGEVVAPIKTGATGEDTDEDGWQPGTDPTTGELTFQPLDPNKKYEVVVRPTTPGESIRVPAIPGITVDKVGVLEVSGIVYAPDGTTPVPGATVKVTVATADGKGYMTLKATTDAEGKYTIEGEGVKLGEEYAIYVDSGKGVETSVQTFSKAQPQTLADITVTKNANEGENTNIIGGAVSHFGQPVKDAVIQVIDKQTGEVVTPGAGSVVTTTSGGGYTLENLPDGTYFVQTTGNGNSGLTEIKVVGGKIEPNTVGGYKTTNISTTKGGIIDGKVDGLKKGETAKVSITVPIYDEAGTEIGAKTVTATAEGEGGYWKIPGVPDGDYPVTVTTPKGVLTGELTVGGGKVTGITPTAPATDDDMKVEGNKLLVKAPATVDPAKKPGTITGVAVDEDGKPISGGTVTIYDEKGDKVEVSPAITTGIGGGYTVTGLPDGKYYVSVDKGGKNGLAGPIQVTGTKTEGKTNVTVSTDESKLLEGVVTDSSDKVAVGATVVVKDASGNVIATTTNSNGQYFVGSVPADATVSIVTKNGESGTPTNLGSGAVLNGDTVTKKPDAGTLTVIGPDGGKLPMVMGPGSSGNVITVATKAEPPVDATAKFEIDENGNLKATAGTEEGTYVVTITGEDGMVITKEIAVDGEEKITTPSPFKITTTVVTGTVKYENGAVPSDATITVPGFGTHKVNTSTGKYEIPGMPDGVYEATIKVVDKDATPTDTTITVTLTVKDGKAEYVDPATGLVVGDPKTNLTVSPIAPVPTVITQIGAANDAIAAAKGDPTKIPDAITAVKDALDAIKNLTDEGRRQLDPDAVKELSKALTDLMSDLSVKVEVGAGAEGVTNTSDVKSELESQKGLLVDKGELDTAATAGKSVDVSLTLKAKDATNDPTPAVQKDVNKVEALATAKNVEKVGYYDITVEKTTVVTESDKPISTTTVTVPQLPTPVELTLSIPADLRGYQYYGVVRVHNNGAAQRIPSTANGTTVTFQSALYSTFAILASNDPIFEGDTKATTETGTGGGGTGTTTGVTVPKRPGGTVTVNPTKPGKGEEFIITVTPDEGYVLDKLTVTDPKGNELTVTPIGGGKYKVTMPNPAVKLTVNATFKKLTGDPHTNGVADLLNVDDHIAYLQGRSGGLFAPDENMTRAEVAQMFYNLLKEQDLELSNKASFPDVSADAWYTKAVNTLANMGIIKGIDGEFKPEQTITRAEFVAIAARFANAATGGDTFADVASKHWAYNEITTATAYGWIDGYGDGTFKPGDNIVRSEAVKVVNRMLDRSADEAYIDAATDIKTFSDVEKKHWAFHEIVEATNAHGFEKKDGVELWTTE